MSDEYLEKAIENGFVPVPQTTSEMRIHCQRPGKTNEDGSIKYFTEQAHKSQCDINKIIARFDKQGVLTHVNKFEAKFGDMTGADFKTMSDKVINAKNMFNELPAKIRNEFDNDPGKLIAFMENPANRERAIELGLISSAVPADLDGIGEHVKDGKKVEKPVEPSE